jgi:precorrin-6A/cobalt-precorrin-6A reductase
MGHRNREAPLSAAIRLLILGGTSQASALATALAGRGDVAPLLSLAGRTANPKPSPIPVRVGGFGGAEGLQRFLEAQRIDAVVDATHPFAERISANAVSGCAAARIPLLVFTRPPWHREPGDRWIDVDGVDAAVETLGSERSTVFLTQGRLQLAAFARAPQHRYIVRAIDPPADFSALREAELILARGPFAAVGEERLMRERGVEVLVSKNSGGDATYAKIEASRRLGVTVVMITPPPAGDAVSVTDLAAALAWIEAHRPAP